MKQVSRLAGAAWIFVALGAVLGGPGQALFAPAAAWGQNLGERIVKGTVLNENSEPVAGATVFLRNQKTKAIRSFDSIANGHYQFTQIDMSVDYDLWAEKNGKKSATKTVSSWDTRKEFVSDLKLK